MGGVRGNLRSRKREDDHVGGGGGTPGKPGGGSNSSNKEGTAGPDVDKESGGSGGKRARIEGGGEGKEGSGRRLSADRQRGDPQQKTQPER